MKKFFTLIELLVVVAIIGILASLLLPSLQKAKLMSYRAVCSSNQKQMGLGMLQYADDNDDFFPGVHTKPGNTMIWATRIRTYLNGDIGIFNCPRQDKSAKWEIEYSGSGAEEYGYYQNEKRITWNVKFGYGMNDWGTDGWDKGRQLGMGNHIANDNVPGKIRVTDIVKPVQHISISESFVDGRWDFVVDPTNNKERVYGVHEGGAQVLYSDGHVLWEKEVKMNSLSEEMRKTWNNDFEPHF